MSAQEPPYASGPLPPHHEHASRGANPLRRTSDTVESWIGGLLTLALLLGLPAAALGAGLTAYESSMRTVQAQTAQRQEVTAQLTSKVKGVVTPDGQQRAHVRWTDDRGAVQTGTTFVKSGTAEGATANVWVDQHGDLTGPPTSKLNATVTGWFAGGMAAAGVGVGFLTARAGMRGALNRRRYAQWDAEWDLVEPVWSARFRR